MMNTNNFGFCENETICHKIQHLIANNLLGVEQLDKIIRRYDDMRNNFFNYPKDFATGDKKEWNFSKGLEPFAPKGRDYYCDTTAVPIPITHPDFIDLTTRTKEQGRGAIGLDLPTWFYQSPEAPFIMLVTQDPLRSAEWYGDKVDDKYICNDVIVSSPFGLQDAHHRERGIGGKRMWLLVQALLERGYNIYLTDCRKYFVYNHRESDLYSTSEKMKLYRDILKKEIEIINPKLIITLGHSADEVCQRLLGNDRRLSGYIPHISGSAANKNDFFNISSGKSINELAEIYAEYIEKLVQK